MGLLGGLAGAFFATSIGGLHLLGLEGWRFAFHVVAGISIAAGLTVLAIGRDPRRKVGQKAAQLAFDHMGQLKQAEDPLESSRQYQLSSDVHRDSCSGRPGVASGNQSHCFTLGTDCTLLRRRMRQVWRMFFRCPDRQSACWATAEAASCADWTQRRDQTEEPRESEHVAGAGRSVCQPGKLSGLEGQELRVRLGRPRT